MYGTMFSSGGESGSFRDNWVDTMLADDLAPCVAMPSATMKSTMQDKGEAF